MATYEELFDIRQLSELINRVAVAMIIKAQVYIDGATPTTEQLTWAAKVLTPGAGRTESIKLYNYLLAVNNTATIAQITSSTDAQIQSSVDSAVDVLVAGGIT